jgi:hypothetical protein
MSEKKFFIPADSLKNLIKPMGACLASDKITVEGLPVKYMYREEPQFEADSGWRFFSGSETQEYVDNPSNSMFYDVNTIANYDLSIIPYLEMPIGVELERAANDIFVVIN